MDMDMDMDMYMYMEYVTCICVHIYSTWWWWFKSMQSLPLTVQFALPLGKQEPRARLLCRHLSVARAPQTGG